MSLTLVIGNKNYSSWSLRPWLAMKQAGVAFNETDVVLGRPDSTEKILRYSPSGRVPCLIDGELTVFDSLAICEYVNERLIEDGRRQPCGRATPSRARGPARWWPKCIRASQRFERICRWISDRDVLTKVRLRSNAATWPLMSRAFSRCGTNALSKAGPCCSEVFRLQTRSTRRS